MTPLFKKLNYKQHKIVLVLNAPASFQAELQNMQSEASICNDSNQITTVNFAMVFVTKQIEIDASIKVIFNKLEGDAVIWFCYPKGSSKKYKCDFNRDTGWQALGKYSLEGVRQVAIDEDWSALRFRKIEYIKTMIRSSKNTLSAAGKKRIQQK